MVSLVTSFGLENPSSDVFRMARNVIEEYSPRSDSGYGRHHHHHHRNGGEQQQQRLAPPPSPWSDQRLHNELFVMVSEVSSLAVMFACRLCSLLCT